MTRSPTQNASRLSRYHGVHLILMIVMLQVIAWRFGAHNELDAFLIAMLFPEIFIQVVTRLLEATLVPSYIYSLKQFGSTRTWKQMWAVYADISFFTGLICLVFLIGSSYFVEFLFKGFDPELRERTTFLMRLCITVSFIFILANIAFRFHYLEKRFRMPAILSMLRPVLIVLSVLILGGGKTASASIVLATVVTGAITVLMLMRPLIRDRSGSWLPALNFSTDFFERMLKNMFPLLLGVSAFWINFAVDRRFATNGGEGSVSRMHYAFTLIFLFSAFFIEPVVGAFTPVVDKRSTRRDYSSMRRSTRRGITYIAMVALPLIVMLYCLADDIVRVMLRHGMFTAHDAKLTANYLRYYSVGLISLPCLTMFSQALFSLRRMFRFTVIGMAIITFNYVAAHTLSTKESDTVLGLTYSFAATHLLWTGLLYFSLRLVIGRIVKMDLIWKLFKLVMASGLTGVGLFHARRHAYQILADGQTDTNLVFLILPVLVIGAVGAYSILLLLFRALDRSDFETLLSWRESKMDKTRMMVS